MSKSGFLKILLVEDNEGDILLTREALGDADTRDALAVARDGEQALAYLDQQAGGNDSMLPDIILLDINLPRMDGKELLATIKSHPMYCHIPVLMLTTSSSGRDVYESYAAHANCYITKPVDFERFVEVIRSIEHYWTQIAQLPTREL
jgi:CheY-like chemotaxis protein